MDNFPATSEASVNLSDVLAAIEAADSSFADQNRGDVEMMNVSGMATRSQVQGGRPMARVEIVEQPASKALRFRYECEGRSAGSIPGVNSTPENKTFPTIRILGYKGRAIVVVSCVTKDLPYRPHPHNLVGKEVCKKGVCTVEVPTENMTMSFDKLGIQCVKRKDIEDALKLREEIRVDPFRTGYDHKRQPTSIDLNAVRLCFQVFLEGQEKGKFTVPLSPVVSEPIYDKKAMSDLVICKLSHCSAPVAGGTEMVLLCEKVAKEDIRVRFFEERDGLCYWEDFADFQPTHVHKQVAIAFRTPRYTNQQVDQPVPIYIQLLRPSDGATSEPLNFQLLPLLDDPKRKRPKIDSPRDYMLQKLQADAKKHSTCRTIGSSEPGLINQPPGYFQNIVKTEPTDRLSPFRPSVSPSLHQYPTPGPSNMNMNIHRPMNSPGDGRTPPPPMEQPFFNITPVQPQQSVLDQLQPIHFPDGAQQLLIEDPNMGNVITVGVEQIYPIDNPDIISNVIGNAIGNAIDVINIDETQQPQQPQHQQQPPPDYDFAELGIVDLNSLNLSDLVRTTVNGEEASGVMEETGMTDSFTKLTRKTMQELCSLNNLYKSTKNN